tara:strand:+ start:209 stop:541 length:333 start_codon:yes stop_codon:yes gene_type:complete
MLPAAKIIKQENNIDVLLMMDCTLSMHHWIREAKENLISIMDMIKKKSKHGCRIRCGYIGYRDFGDIGQTKEHFDLMDFTEDHQAVKDMISKSEAKGGDDTPEDVIGALD